MTTLHASLSTATMSAGKDTRNMEKLISTEEAAALVRLRPQTMRSLRSKGGGPAFIKLAPNRVAYSAADLEKWTEERKRRSTADPGPSRAV